MSDSAPRIALFARFPTPGHTKTRLHPVLSPDAAAALHARLVARTLATVRASGLPHAVHGTGASAARFAEWLGDKVPFVDQGGGDLGERMARVATPAIIIGADIPDLSADHLHQAAAAVAAGRVVIGPAADGGYYLIGLPAPAEYLFEEMPWGTDRVLVETLARLGEQAVAPVMLAMLADLDRPEDLARWPHLAASDWPEAAPSPATQAAG
ncbi:MAG: hypothetical protein C0476_00310 [Sphingomonas sp.]|nr:hypothetical protein [Sphingomonas sp.]